MSPFPSLVDLAPDTLLTEDEAADYLRIRPSALKTMRLRGRSPAFVRIGRSVRFRCDAIRTFLDDATDVPTGEVRSGAPADDPPDVGAARVALVRTPADPAVAKAPRIAA